MKFRHWLVKKLLKEDEKFLICVPVNDRIDELRLFAINNKLCDKKSTYQDIGDLFVLKKMFVTENYN